MGSVSVQRAPNMKYVPSSAAPLFPHLPHLSAVLGVNLWAALPVAAAGDGVRHKDAGVACHLLRHREGPHPGKL